MTIEVRLAHSVGELAALYQFRYQIYVEEMGRPQKYADHGQRLICDPLDETAYNVLALDCGKIVGCVRVNLARDGALEYYNNILKMDIDRDLYPEHVSLCTRLMIDKSYRKSNLAVRLSLECFDIGLQQGSATNFIDCNDHWVGFFKRLGYKQLHQAHHEEYGLVNAMSFDLTDLNNILGAQSPYADRYLRWRSESFALAHHLKDSVGQQIPI